jgi:hypothetical protein
MARDDRLGRRRARAQAQAPIDDDAQIGPNVASESGNEAVQIFFALFIGRVAGVQCLRDRRGRFAISLNRDGNEPDVDENTIRADETPGYSPALLETNVDEGLNPSGDSSHTSSAE